ncbi:hypothetical protein Mal15_38150 [Stieleria maiorica]|uniref:Uncharacterized protein n=1 Tax=Stieleria maiorica TaxID=2795974 RepID=A0A5B9MGW7_9BACT|nr:hypothetical protein Mal15_38150 [Stieleria maiorica]
MSDTQPAAPVPWSDVPFLYAPRIRCPYCEADRPINVRSTLQGDDSIERRYTCRSCSRRFRIIAEKTDETDWLILETLPDSGTVEKPFCKIRPTSQGG